MVGNKNLISAGFNLSMKNAPAQSRVWIAAVERLNSACALERQTKHRPILAVLAVMQLTDGAPGLAKDAGATR